MGGCEEANREKIKAPLALAKAGGFAYEIHGGEDVQSMFKG